MIAYLELKLTKNADLDKYGYSDYGIGFETLSQFSWSDGEWVKNVVMIGVVNRSSVHVDNKEKDIFVFGERPTYYIIAKYFINFTRPFFIFITISYLLIPSKYINSKKRFRIKTISNVFR